MVDTGVVGQQVHVYWRPTPGCATAPVETPGVARDRALAVALAAGGLLLEARWCEAPFEVSLNGHDQQVAVRIGGTLEGNGPDPFHRYQADVPGTRVAYRVHRSGAIAVRYEGPVAATSWWVPWAPCPTPPPTSPSTYPAARR